ncbi:FliH/SctL family protein [Parasporobacterium paucivorans]|uniref:Flagellar assembly protein FliH n=1 Tax=Parasporobacterium paucivorans DSM 15970 TaxID=1122934 RepID=A0A1M6I7V9_9FIRM|nr:FliH/SctL family protein [Parasporobacterium paucivorans]SHJ30475.1 flagellar assembly protein FliH [Parasporobacterium paucivorans DSM 15970]
MARNMKDEGVRPYQFYLQFGEELTRVQPEELSGSDCSESEIVLLEAREKAGQILEEARAESEKIRSDAYETAAREGHKSGYEQGRQEAYEEHAKKLREDTNRLEEEIARAIEDMENKKALMMETHLNDLKNISVSIAEKIIKTSLSASEEIIKRMIISAADKLKKSQWAKIYISDSDSDRIVKGDAALIRELGKLSDNIKIIAMDGEEEGTCIIELPEEIIDASVNTQLENIRDILNNARL